MDQHDNPPRTTKTPRQGDHPNASASPPSSGPPAHTRFKPGQSGNPRGRPKGRKNLKTVIDRELSKVVAIQENGRSKRVTKQEVIVQRLAHDSIKGMHRATDLLIRLVGDGPVTDAGEAAAATQRILMPDREALRRIKGRLDRLVPEEG